MPVYEVETPDGRFIRHRVDDLDAFKLSLQHGYVVRGEVLGADGALRGGFVESIEPGAKSVLALLLDAHGDELEDWLLERGIIPHHQSTSSLSNEAVAAAVDHRMKHKHKKAVAFE